MGPVTERNPRVAVAISGPQGAGKTTLCYQVASDLKRRSVQCGVVTDTARTSLYLAHGLKSPEMHLEIMVTHIASELRARLHYQVVVCDRSVLDFLAYYRIRFPNATGYVKDTLEGIARAYTASYDMIFTVTHFFGNLDKDPLRAMEETSPVDFSNQLNQIINESAIQHRSFLGVPDAEEISDYVLQRLIQLKIDTL